MYSHLISTFGKRRRVSSPSSTKIPRNAYSLNKPKIRKDYKWTESRRFFVTSGYTITGDPLSCKETEHSDTDIVTSTLDHG